MAAMLALASPRTSMGERGVRHMSALPAISAPPSPRALPRGYCLRQIGDGSYLPIIDPARPSTPSPRRAPLLQPGPTGEAQREVVHTLEREVARCDATRRSEWEITYKKMSGAAFAIHDFFLT